ncbi:hypothetical protein [Tessaracoccus sp. Y1736]
MIPNYNEARWVPWSAFALLWLMPRIHPTHWFEHGIADFGQSLGNVATGFVLVDIAGPDHRTRRRGPKCALG